MLRVCLECSENYSSWNSGKNGNAEKELGHQIGTDLAMHLSPPGHSTTLYPIAQGLSNYLKHNGIAIVNWNNMKTKVDRATNMIMSLKIEWRYIPLSEAQVKRKIQARRGRAMIMSNASESSLSVMRSEPAGFTGRMCGFELYE